MAIVKASDIAAEIARALNDRRLDEGEGHTYVEHVGGGFIYTTHADGNGARRSFMIEVKAIDE